MSLSKSIVSTFAIFTLVWGTVFVNTSKYRGSDSTDTAIDDRAAINALIPDVIGLTGIRTDISLGDDTEEINAVWEKFYGSIGLHMSVAPEVSRSVYAHYRFTNQNLARAELVIGYNTMGKEIDGYSVFPPVSTMNYEQTFESFESWNTTPGWNAIDAGRVPHAVMEVYMMDGGGEVGATRVYVLYKQ